MRTNLQVSKYKNDIMLNLTANLGLTQYILEYSLQLEIKSSHQRLEDCSYINVLLIIDWKMGIGCWGCQFPICNTK